MNVSLSNIKIFACIGEMQRALFAPIVIGVSYDDDPNESTNAGNFCRIKQGDNDIFCTEPMLREMLLAMQAALAELETRRCNEATSDSIKTSA